MINESTSKQIERIKNRIYKKGYNIEYFVKEDAGVVVCKMSNGLSYVTGKSKCAPDDVFDYQTGCAISLLRAANKVMRGEIKSRESLIKTHMDIIERANRCMHDFKLDNKFDRRYVMDASSIISELSK